MARYIDADALSIYFDALIKHAEMEGLYNMAHVYERCLQIVNDAPTADVAPRAEWISVEERLPDRNGVFLVSLKESGYENLVYFDVIPYADGEWRNLPDKFTVSHWMPLPEPPKGD